MAFDEALKYVLHVEGGYTNDPHDPGGATNFGIIQREYDAWRRKQNQHIRSVRFIDKVEYTEIYRTQYWEPLGCDKLSPGYAYCLFDAGVNSGIGRAKQWQRQTSDVDTFCDIRLRFLKKLRTWQYFGNGWSARVAYVREHAHKMEMNMTTAPTATAATTVDFDTAIENFIAEFGGVAAPVLATIPALAAAEKTLAEVLPEVDHVLALISTFTGDTPGIKLLRAISGGLEMALAGQKPN